MLEWRELVVARVLESAHDDRGCAIPCRWSRRLSYLSLVSAVVDRQFPDRTVYPRWEDFDVRHLRSSHKRWLGCGEESAWSNCCGCVRSPARNLPP